MPIEKITIFCFGASYAVALALELVLLFWPRRLPRLLRTVAASAGIVAHTLFLAVQRPPLASQFGSLLFLAWILAVFYLYGSVHHGKLAWGIFVLPLVLGLIVLATVFAPASASGPAPDLHGFQYVRGMLDLDWGKFWTGLHGVLLLLAAVGVCVGFVASVMYLVQARRLRVKALPGEGLRMLSLERLEEMNRRAINLAFPLLTAGVLVGAALMAQYPWRGLSDPKVLGAVFLWLLFVLLLFLRYGAHLSGRRLAFLTILAFTLLLITLASPAHRFLPGGGLP